MPRNLETTTNSGVPETPAKPDNKLLKKAIFSLRDIGAPNTDLAPLINLVNFQLEAYEGWRNWLHPHPHYKRAHHINSDRDLTHMGIINHIFDDNRMYWENGATPTTKFYETISTYVIEYLRQLRTRGHFVHHTDPVTQQPVYYDVDITGSTEVQALKYLEGEAQVFYRTLRSPGSTEMLLTAFPDRRCEACTTGSHCRHHTLAIPEQYVPQSEATRFFRGFHLRDANILANYYRKYNKEVTIAEYYPIELVLKWIQDQDLEDQAAKHGVSTFSYHGQYIVPVALKTTLCNYRKNLWDSQVLAVPKDLAHYTK